jgi:carbamoyl-phosphate synthase large subunit
VAGDVPVSDRHQRTVTVLLSSGGRRGALLRAVRDGGVLAGVELRVVVTDRSPLSAAGHLADAFHLVPSVTAPDFVDAMVEVIESESVDVIVPTIDPELQVLSENRDALEAAGARVLVADTTTIERCSDKATSSRWLAKQGFPIPRQYERDELAELDAGAWPLFFKPRQGSSSIGAHPIASITELDLAIERFGAGVTEELIVGDEFTMDCWVDGTGHCRCVVPRLRLATRAGEIAKGMTVRNEALQAEVAEVVDAFGGIQGPASVQAIMAPDGPRFIEINPRFGGGYPLSHEAGATYTASLIAEAAGLPIDESWFKWEEDLVMLRYDDAVFVPKSAVDRIGS